LEGESFP